LGYFGLSLSRHVRAQYLVHASLVVGARRSEEIEYVGIDPQGDLAFVSFGNQEADTLPRYAVRSGNIREIYVIVGQAGQACF
jgi:hypothetical protein